MRIIPIVFYLNNYIYLNDLDTTFNVIREVAGLTHSYDISIISCSIYVIFALELLKTKNKVIAYKNMIEIVSEKFKDNIYISKFDSLKINMKFHRIY